MPVHGALGLRTRFATNHILTTSRQTYSQPALILSRTAHAAASTHSCSVAAHVFPSVFSQSTTSPSYKHWRQPTSSHAACPTQTSFLYSQASELFQRKLHTQGSQQLPKPQQPTEQQPGIKAQLPKPVANLQQRAVGYLRESLLLSYSAVFDNVIFRAAEWLRLDKLFQWITPGLEDGYATLTGWQQTNLISVNVHKRP